MPFKKKTAAAPEEEKKDTGAADQVEVQEQAEEQADIPTVEEVSKLPIDEFRGCLIDLGIKFTNGLDEKSRILTPAEVEQLKVIIEVFNAVNVVMPK